MDINKIKVLIQAVENGSLLSTAAKLGYTQAGLSHMMRSLESELGVVLLKRGKFGIRLTKEGERLMPFFRELTAVSENLDREVELILQQKASVIRIASIASVIRTWLPDVISAFQKEYPEFSFEIKEGDASMYKWYDQGLVDMCITCNIVNRRDFVPLMTDEFFACLPPDYPIGEGDVFPLKRFESESYISATCGEDYDIQALLDKYDVHPKKQNTRVDDASVLSMVSRGLGVSLIPRLVLDSSKAEIKAVPLDVPCERRIGLVIGKPSELSPAVKRFIRFLNHWEF